MDKIINKLRETRKELQKMEGTGHLVSELIDVTDTLHDIEYSADKALLTLQILCDDLHLPDAEIPQFTLKHLAANPGHYRTLSDIVFDYLAEIRGALADNEAPAAPSNEREV